MNSLASPLTPGFAWLDLVFKGAGKSTRQPLCEHHGKSFFKSLRRFLLLPSAVTFLPEEVVCALVVGL